MKSLNIIHRNFFFWNESAWKFILNPGFQKFLFFIYLKKVLPVGL